MMNVLSLDVESARHGAEVRKALLSQGEDIGMADSLIAGICLREGALLVTRNRRHFARVEGLKLSTDCRTSRVSGWAPPAPAKQTFLVSPEYSARFGG